MINNSQSIPQSLRTILAGNQVDQKAARDAMAFIMRASGQDKGVIKDFLLALNEREASVEELVGFIEAIRTAAVSVDINGFDKSVVDTCGTGGDGLDTFNISTTSAFVLAGAGVPVAKHGNRAASSRCGSADVLEELGVKIVLNAAGVKRCIKEAGIGFMFAPAFHPAMKQVAAARKELGVRTVFNYLGPLTNPAGVKRQVIGVSDKKMAGILAEVAQQLESEHILIVHGAEGMDEISLSESTQLHEVKNGEIRVGEIQLEGLGLARTDAADVQGGSVAENANIVRSILMGQLADAKRDIVVVNAAAALYVAGVVEEIREGVPLALEAITSGKALKALEKLQQITNRLDKEAK